MKPDLMKLLKEVVRTHDIKGRPLPFHSSSCCRDGDTEECPLCSWRAEQGKAINDLTSALQSARKSGAVPVLLSREAVEALRDARAKTLHEATSAYLRAAALVERDLGDVLK